MSELQQLEELQRDHRRMVKALKEIVSKSTKNRWWGVQCKNPAILKIAQKALEENERHDP